MKVNANASNLDDVQLKVEIEMTIGEWNEIRDHLPGTYFGVVHQFMDGIDKAFEKVKRGFYPEEVILQK